MTIDSNINPTYANHVIATSADTILKYSGTWLDGQRHGQGKQSFTFTYLFDYKVLIKASVLDGDRDLTPLKQRFVNTVMAYHTVNSHNMSK